VERFPFTRLHINFARFRENEIHEFVEALKDRKRSIIYSKHEGKKKEINPDNPLDAHGLVFMKPDRDACILEKNGEIYRAKCRNILLEET
jgi:hypothetical protein